MLEKVLNMTSNMRAITGVKITKTHVRTRFANTCLPTATKSEKVPAPLQPSAFRTKANKHEIGSFVVLGGDVRVFSLH